ncbi:DsbA family protein [Rhodovulum adriaticum]|uniref:Thioredoxin-like protein n=1 Tax=Rhodovulum adriaticum TaxID=35804 RepID=A0A4R2NVF6_RHOAD|nr:DsbA family protein [Rhodovulum adriaticum]MBK1636462.1 hypothetical protein [Rhodovulum adriaticum]TCP25534.1 thioredoxin-like protein [Rhodovulum adriaticum]
MNAAARPALALILAASPAPALDLSEAERTALGAELRAYLLEHPEIITQALQGAEAKRQAAHAADDIALLQAHATALFHAGGDWTGGAENGDLTLVSFVDYRDPASARAWAAARDLVAQDPALRWVVKEAPTPDAPDATRAARFAQAVLRMAGPRAHAQAQAALFAAPDAAPETLAGIAAELGLDAAPLARRMSDPAITAKLDQTRRLMQALDLQAAPAQVLDRAMVRGEVPAVALARIVAALRRKK